MSVDGFLKFWRKVQGGLEFVKTYRAHAGKITGSALSLNEQRLATVCSKDQALKVFDVLNFDLMHMIRLKFVPDMCEFIHKASSFSSVIAITQYQEAVIHLIKAETPEGQVLKVLRELHFSPIRTIKYIAELDLVVSSDDSGMIEVWDPETYGI
jgi:peptidylprolyl isomerase domain and WD repeat-containing protein 1